MRRLFLLALLAVLAACRQDPVAAPEGEPGTLVRPGTTPVLVRSGDLDGDGDDELVIASASEERSSFGLPVPHLEVFATRGSEWARVFDATGAAPPGEGAPPSMLEPPGEFAVGQSVPFLELVDFHEDGTPEIVAAISNAGAGEGPLELWIVGASADLRMRTVFYRRTARGGQVDVTAANAILLEHGVYRKRDPGCCPSVTETLTIGAVDGRIDVVATDRRRNA